MAVTKADKRREGAWIVTLFVLVELALALAAPIFTERNRQVWDTLFRVRNAVPALRPPYDDRVVFVDIGDPSLEQLGTTQLDRRQHAEIVSALEHAGVKAQFHDVIFARASTPEADDTLTSAARLAPTAYFGYSIGLVDRLGSPSRIRQEHDQELARHTWKAHIAKAARVPLAGDSPLLPFPSLAQNASGLGFIDIQPDRDGVIRRVPLLVTAGKEVLPSATLSLAARMMDLDTSTITVDAGHTIRIQCRGSHDFNTNRSVAIPIDDTGSMIVNFLGPWDSMRHYEVSSILGAGHNLFQSRILSEELAGRAAIVAYTSTGGTDVGAVPSEPRFVLAGVHAHALNTILTGQHLREMDRVTRVAFIDAPLVGLLLLFAPALGAPLIVALTAGLAAILFLAIAGAFFFEGTLVPVYEPTILLLGTSITAVTGRYTSERHQRELLRSTLDAYFPPGLVDRLLSAREGFRPTGRRKEVTILFSDIVGYTSYSTTVAAEKVQSLLNEYFGTMAEVVFRHGGTLDKFLGDGMLVFFGDPEPQHDHALRAVKCAIDMQIAARDLRAQWEARGDLPIMIRIGVNTGEAIVGNMGSPRRMSYTVIGDNVNLAQRLESSAVPGSIYISARTRDMLDDQVATSPAGALMLKGFKDPVDVFKVDVRPPS